MSKKPRRGWIWPDVSTLEGSKWATRQAFWAAVFCMSVTLILAVLGAFGIQLFPEFKMDAWSLLDAGIYGAVAFGLHRYSRFAAVSGLAVYLFERVVMWTEAGFKSPVMAIILTLLFIGGVRGTWAYRRHTRVVSTGADAPVMPT
jgi:hypothetical protein